MQKPITQTRLAARISSLLDPAAKGRFIAAGINTGTDENAVRRKLHENGSTIRR